MNMKDERRTDVRRIEDDVVVLGAADAAGRAGKEGSFMSGAISQVVHRHVNRTERFDRHDSGNGLDVELVTGWMQEMAAVVYGGGWQKKRKRAGAKLQIMTGNHTCT